MMSSTSKYNYSACGPRNTLLPIGFIPTLEMILHMFISVKQSQFLPFCSMPIDKPRTKKHNSWFSNVLVLTVLFVGRYSARFLLGLQTHQLQLGCWNQILDQEPTVPTDPILLIAENEQVLVVQKPPGLPCHPQAGFFCGSGSVKTKRTDCWC